MFKLDTPRKWASFLLLTPGLICVWFLAAHATVDPVGPTQQVFYGSSMSDLPSMIGVRRGDIATIGSTSPRFLYALPTGSKSIDNVHVFTGPPGSGVIFCDEYAMAQSISPSAVPSITNAMVSSTAAIDLSKLANCGSGQFLIGTGVQNTCSAMSDALHGSLGGGSDHAVVTSASAGFLAAVGTAAGRFLATTGSGVAPTASVPWSVLSGVPSAFAPSAHAPSHISTGSDPIPSAVASGASGLLTGADKAKLNSLSVPPDWHATGGADWKPPLVDAGTGMKITNSSTTAVIEQNYPVPYWHITGATDMTPTRIDVSRGITIADDGVGGVLIETNFDPGLKQDNPVVATVGSSRAYGYASPPIPFAAPVNHTTTNVGPINAADYGEDFNVGTGSTYHLIRVELEVVGFAETSPVGSGKMFSRTFRGMLYRLRSNQHCGIGYDMLPVTALDLPDSSCPGPGCVTSAAITLSGSNNCNVTFGIEYDSSADSSADWEAAVRFFGGGRY